MKTALFLPLLALLTLPGAALAQDFSFDFDWGDIPLCTTGNPGSVPNPIFRLKNVPDGTEQIKFSMKDLDAPRYQHGGGKVAWNGEDTIMPGAFTYLSPCPPHGSHRYRWTATARNGGGKLAKARAEKTYPE